MRFGVVGWGLRGGLALLAHKPEEDLHLVALADPSAEAQAKFQQKVPTAQVFDDHRQLLNEGLDAVFVLSPDWLHEEHAIDFLSAGISVYLEKPMAITTVGCDRILETAHRSGAKLYVGHNMRHFGVVRQMKEAIDGGLIGDVKAAWCRHFISYGGEAYYRDWHADRSKSTGLLLQKGAHDIDVMHWLCGGFAKRVTAMGKLSVYGDIEDRRGENDPVNLKIEATFPPDQLRGLNPVVDVEDLNMVLMELDNGVLASYQQCHYAPDAWRNYCVIGSAGRIENFGDAPGRSVVRLWNKGRLQYDPVGDLEWIIPPSDGGHGGADERTVGEFVRYLRDGSATDATPQAARMSVAAAVAATESLRDGSRPVDVPVIPSFD